MSYRRLAVLLRHASPGSAFALSYHGAAGSWTPTDYILASLHNVFIDAQPWKTKPPHIPFPEPKQRKPKHGMTAAQAWALFDPKER